MNSQSLSFTKLYLVELDRGDTEWSAFEWMHTDCLPDLIKLTCLLPAQEDNLSILITKVNLESTSLVHIQSAPDVDLNSCFLKNASTFCKYLNSTEKIIWNI